MNDGCRTDWILIRTFRHSTKEALQARPTIIMCLVFELCETMLLVFVLIRCRNQLCESCDVKINAVS